MPIATSVIFEELGFQRISHEPSSVPAYRTFVGSAEVEAVLLTNRWFRQAWMLGGMVNTGRTLSMIEGELPLEVESREQGLALVSYFLTRHIPEASKPPWLRIGERMSSHLPWARQRQD